MGLSYDVFTSAFLAKITEYEFIRLPDDERVVIVDDYMKRAIASFKPCKYNLINSLNDNIRMIEVDVAEEDLQELVDIISEGMLTQWLKQYVYKQELLENSLNTRDFQTYSPAELLMRVGNAYAKVQKDYTQMVREYSFNHGDLTTLHL